MSSQHPSDARSAAPEDRAGVGDGAGSDFTLASLVQIRGAPLIDALDRHAPGSREHADATGSYAFATAVELGHDRSRAELAREAAKLHAVGGVYVPAATLARPAAERTPAERSEVDGLHEAGCRLARAAGVPEQVCGWILRIRERYDGRGPDRLAGPAIPLESRIARAACCCDRALADPGTGEGTTPDRPQGRAIAALREDAGRALDPRVVESLSGILGRVAGGATD